MSGNLPSLFGKIKNITGQSSEERVDHALQLLLEREEIDGYKRSNKLEKKGIDCLVIRGTKHYKLSVKSSEGGIGHEREVHPRRYRHEDIIFIVPGVEESRESVARRILEMMGALEQRFKEND